MIKTKANKKFDIDLKYGQIREDHISAMFKDKKIEVKTERDWWYKTGNIALEYECNIIIVHRHPKSKHLHEKMNYRNSSKEVLEHLEENVSQLIDKGINKQKIFIDPGLGFGKFAKDSVDLLINIKDLVNEIPIVVGYSRKKFIENLEMNNKEIFEHCINSGVAFVRLHLTI